MPENDLITYLSLKFFGKNEIQPNLSWEKSVP